MSRKRRKKPNLHKSPEKPQVSIVSKTRSWTLPTVLGLILGIVGAVGVVELRPQMAVNTKEPIEINQPLSAPFILQNIGYFSFWVDDAYCGIDEVDIGGWVTTDSAYEEPHNRAHSLDRSEGMTLMCYMGKGSIPTKAKIGIIADYRPWRSFPWVFQRQFKFSGRYINNWQWTPEPSD